MTASLETMRKFLLGERTQPDSLQEGDQKHFIREGMLLDLFLEGNKKSIALLKSTAAHSPYPETAHSALKLLVRSVKLGNDSAREALFALAVYNEDARAAKSALENRWLPEDPPEKALFLFLLDQVPEYFAVDPHHKHLTQAYRKAPPEVRTRIIRAAENRNMSHWLQLIAFLDSDRQEAVDHLLDNAENLKEGFRDIILEILITLAEEGRKSAQAALCQWFIQFEDLRVKRIVLEKGYTPLRPANMAIFLLLTGQWEAYDSFDFNRSYLSLAYELADRQLRRRIITQARKLGRIEWEQVFGAGRKIRFAEDMHEEEWALALAVLSENQRWDELWRLVNIAPPLWSARGLLALARAGYDWPPETEGVERLVAMAETAGKTHPGIYRANSIKAHQEGITSLAGHMEKNLLFTAGRDQSVRIWKHGQKRSYETLLLKSGLALTMRYDPDNGLLTTGNSDNGIYIYRLHDHHLVKQFLGHSAPVRAFAKSSDGHILASGSFDKTVRLWRYPYGPELNVINAHEGEIFALASSPLEPILASAGADKHLRTFRFSNLAPLTKTKAHQDTILSLAAGNQSQILASSSRDHSIKFWSYGDFSDTAEIQTPGAVFSHLAFLMEDQYLLGADMEGHLSIWSVYNRKKLISEKAHNGAITGLQCFDQGHLLASGGMDGILNIWNLSLFSLVRTPLLKITPENVEETRRRFDTAHQSPEAEAWLAYTEGLVKWRSRFDIQIEDSRRINLGEFDIEL
jgi:hypothetical protein